MVIDFRRSGLPAAIGWGFVGDVTPTYGGVLAMPGVCVVGRGGIPDGSLNFFPRVRCAYPGYASVEGCCRRCNADLRGAHFGYSGYGPTGSIGFRFSQARSPGRDSACNRFGILEPSISRREGVAYR